MRLNFFVPFLLTLASTVCGQNQFIDKDYDCNLLDWKYQYIKRPNKLDTALNQVECLVIRDRFDKGMNMLDSLIRVYPDSGKLYRRKAYFHWNHNFYDTTYFALLRKTIDLNFDIGSSLGTYASFCFNFVSFCEESKSPIKLPIKKKNELLNVSERYCLKAIPLDNQHKDSYLELLASIQQKRSYVAGKKPVELKFNNEFDTLILVSQLMDCGEFGGHLEYIKCYHVNGELMADFSMDPPYCDYEEKGQTCSHSYKSKRQKVNSTDLDSYIKHFKTINPNPGIETNAPTSFWVLKDANIYFIRDWTGKSKEYESFRDTIFKE